MSREYAVLSEISRQLEELGYLSEAVFEDVTNENMKRAAIGASMLVKQVEEMKKLMDFPRGLSRHASDEEQPPAVRE